MKVDFKHMVNGYTGKVDDLVYYYNRQTNRVYVRRRPNRKPDATNQGFGAILHNVRILNPDSRFREDWQMYVAYYNAVPENHNNPVCAWINLFLKVYFAMGRYIPGIDLSTLTKQQIIDQNLPCISLKHAVETGYLPAVMGYERFEHSI